MKSSYISKFEYTEKIIVRAAKFICYGRTAAVLLHILLVAVGIAGGAFSIYYAASGVEPEYHYSTYIFYALAPLAAEAAVYIKYRKIIKKEKSRIGESGCEAVASVSEDILCSKQNGETVTERNLFDAERIYESKCFFIVAVLPQEYVIFKKGCFIEGEEAEFASDVKNRIREIHKEAIEKGKVKQV